MFWKFNSLWVSTMYARLKTLVAQMVKNLPAMQETRVGKIPWRRDRLPTPLFLNFPGGSDHKEFACNAGDPGSVPGLGGFLEGRHGKPTPVFFPEESHGQRSLVGCSPRGYKESDLTERLTLSVFCCCCCSFFF